MNELLLGSILVTIALFIYWKTFDILEKNAKILSDVKKENNRLEELNSINRLSETNYIAPVFKNKLESPIRIKSVYRANTNELRHSYSKTDILSLIDEELLRRLSDEFYHILDKQRDDVLNIKNTRHEFDQEIVEYSVEIILVPKKQPYSL